MGPDEEKGGFDKSTFTAHVTQLHRIISITEYEKLVAEYENLRKAILENNVNITKRIINDLNIDREIVVNFAPREDNSLLFM